MSTGIDYADLIDRVLADPVARSYMRDSWESIAPLLFDERSRTEGKLRVSDSGSCALGLWADLHDQLTIPEDFKPVDSRMQPGILDGARTAAIIAAGIKRWYWPLTTVLEPRLDCGGILGHADVIVYAEPDPVEVIECKMTFYTKGIEAPEKRHRYWIHQACRYAQGVDAHSFVVLVHAPAVWHGPTRQGFRYRTADYAEETDQEYARLLQATLDEPPEADAEEDFRCRSCRFSQCERNMNPRMPIVERVIDGVGVV